MKKLGDTLGAEIIKVSKIDFGVLGAGIVTDIGRILGISNVFCDIIPHSSIPYLSGRIFGWKGLIVGSTVNLVYEVLQGNLIIPGDVDLNDIHTGTLFAILACAVTYHQKKYTTLTHQTLYHIH